MLIQMDLAEERAFSNIMTYLSVLRFDPALVEDVADKLYTIVRSAYDVQLSSKEFKELVHSQVEGTYRAFAAEDALRVSSNLTVADTRAIRFLENSDSVYLGQFINNPMVKQHVVDYIKHAYLENGAAIGNSPTELRAFMAAFKDQLDLEKWQVRRIIDTTVSHARVFGQLNSMRQAGVKTFVVSGPDDNLTCEFCQEMLGRKFSLAEELPRLEQILSNGAEGIPYVKPFLKGSMQLQDLKDASDADVQADGFACPPYHPHCRHQLSAVDFYEDATEIPYSVEAA